MCFGNGKDPKVIMPELIKMGILKAGKDGKMTINTRIDRNSTPIRMYHLTFAGFNKSIDNQEEADNANAIEFPLTISPGLDFN